MICLKRVLTIIIFGVAFLFFSPLGMSLSYGLQTWPLSPLLAPFLSPGLIFLQILGWGVILLTFPIAFVCSIFMISLRRHWPLLALASLCVWGSLWVFRPPRFWPMRRVGLEKSVAQLNVLSPALEKFHRENRTYPEHLGELVPKYLNRIPETGMTAYPKLRYKRGDARNRLPRYELIVNTNFGMAFDALYYNPESDYEFLRNSGRIERIGAWAYLHE